MEPAAVVLRALLVSAVVFGIAACSDDNLDRIDGGTADSGTETPDAQPSPDAEPRDAGAPDAEAFPCDPFAPPATPEQPAALTGRLDITDYDSYFELSGGQYRSRTGGFNFFTQTLPVQPLSDGVLFTGIAPDTCISTDILAPTMSLAPKRNVGTSIELANTGTVTVRFRRDQETDGPTYKLATQADTLRFFDPKQVKLDDTWTWSSPGDSAAGIRAFAGSVPPVEEFAVTPVFTASSAPMLMDMNGTTIRWTAPRATPGAMAIVLGRALNPMGDGHYLICRPADDGEYTISAADMTLFGPTPDLAFSLSVTRAAAAAFCNEGVQAGAAVHALVYLGTGVVH